MGSIEDRVQKQQVQVWDMSTDMENCTTATVSSDLFVPIFILTCYCDMDLWETLHSYARTLTLLYEIIILNYNLFYPPMLEFLQEL